MMKNPRILVLTSNHGLNANILKLAFSPWNHETHFAALENATEELSQSSNLSSIQWVVLDDIEAKNSDEIYQYLANNLSHASGIYLSTQEFSKNRPAGFRNIHFIKKPFEPKVLRELLQS